jgi:hypothetical protein
LGMWQGLAMSIILVVFNAGAGWSRQRVRSTGCCSVRCGEFHKLCYLQLLQADFFFDGVSHGVISFWYTWVSKETGYWFSVGDSFPESPRILKVNWNYTLCGQFLWY